MTMDEKDRQTDRRIDRRIDWLHGKYNDNDTIPYYYTWKDKLPLKDYISPVRLKSFYLQLILN